MIVFRHADPRFPFLWEGGGQPPARWHAAGEGPAHYLSDTPDGAWAEFIRHEEIKDPEDVATIERALWAVEIPDTEPETEPDLPDEVLTGGPETYSTCQDEAQRIRDEGATRLVAPSAALLPGEARGWRVDGDLIRGEDRNGQTIVLFGDRPQIVGWQVVAAGRPTVDILHKVRYFGPDVAIGWCI